LAEVSGIVFVDLVPVDRVASGEAVRRRRALGPLEEALQGLLGMRADEPLPPSSPSKIPSSIRLASLGFLTP
jgi:hypothetical protein